MDKPKHRPPIPQKGQPRRIAHCKKAALKHGANAVDAVAAQGYIAAFTRALDALKKQGIL